MSVAGGSSSSRIRGVMSNMIPMLLLLFAVGGGGSV
jgi:hypothetical protein